MDKLGSISRFDIETNLTNQLLLITRIISLAMIAGQLILLLLILFILSGDFIGVASLATFGDILFFVYTLIALAVVVYTVFLLFPGFFLSPLNLKKQFAKDFKKKIW